MDGVFGPLYSYGIAALKRFKPTWFLAENVGGLRNSNDGTAFAKILSEMREAGYNLTPHLYKFEEYGIPQARHRIIIIGISDDENVNFRVPSPEPYSQTDNSARTAIEVPPIPENCANNELTRQSPTVVRRLQHIKPGENAFTANLPDELKLNVKGAKISQIYKRLEPHKPAYTVTGREEEGAHVPLVEPRALTNRASTITDISGHLCFSRFQRKCQKTNWHGSTLSGAQIIFEAVLRSFAGIEYPWDWANINE